MESIASVLPTMVYGGDYNPEQWPEEVWLEDARLMQKAGVNLVSLGIFSWAKIEPRDGEYDFKWLDQVINLLHEHGVAVNLATATASTPAWFVKKYPDSLPVSENGVTYSFGGRQHYCPNHPHLVQHIKRLVRTIATRYKDHPALKMWHINNEYACHVSKCYCDNCAEAFRTWLKKRYKDIEELNSRWGTAFWSQRYNEWDEISPPRKAPTFCNPSQQLDYHRFMSDSILNLYLTEKEILREITPNIPLSTNFMGPFKPLDYYRWAEEVDIVTWDSYPDPTEGLPITHSMMNDLMRSLRKGQPFILMEQTPSQVNWREINVLKPPGVMRLWSYSTIGHGADGIMFFQWRQGRAGSEKFHGAMVPHSNKEESRVYQEVRQLGNELKKLGSLIGARTPARVAIIFDWENWWAVELDSKPHNKLHYVWRVQAYYEECYKRNIQVDFVRASDQLENYDLVIAPLLYMIKPGEQGNLEQFVSNGGTLVVSYFSGIVDENDRIYLGGYPVPLRKLLGITVEEFSPFAEGKTGIVLADGREYECSLWSDIIRLEGAEELAEFGSGWYKGYPAVTENRFGNGKAVYVGTELPSSYLEELLTGLTQEKGLKAPMEAPPHVEVLERNSTSANHYIIINHNEDAVTIELPAHVTYVNLLTGEEIKFPSLTIKGIDVAILKYEL
jgi:beta-galactosidase